MWRKEYKKPKIERISLDKEISLVLMSWNDDDDPPDDPFGSQAAPTANPFEENAFDKPLE